MLSVFRKSAAGMGHIIQNRRALGYRQLNINSLALVKTVEYNPLF
jgi:hypothetical protein